MRSILSSLAVLCFLALQASAQVPPAYRASQLAKPESFGLPLVPAAPGVLGDGFSNPIVIGALPYSDARNDCAFLNNVQGGACGGTGPDVVYAFTPTLNVCATISLCDPFTNFDTVLDLYLNSSSTLVRCSDDLCGQQSEIANVTLFAGNTYYIVVDGLGGACGNYQLRITLCPPACNVAIPAGATAEAEPICSDGSVDTYDAGCNSTPFTAMDVPCSTTPVTLSGRYGNFSTAGINFRDTDWYRVVAGQPTTLVATVNGELSGVIAIVDVLGGCANIVERAPLQLTSPCTPYTVSATVPAGSYYVFVAPADFTGSPCSARYALTVSGTACVSRTAWKSWGFVKAMYR